MTFMRGFLQKIAVFMQGRYGNDRLNNFLFVILFIIWAVNIFMFNRTVRLIIDLIMLALLALILFRTFSRNISRRTAENRAFSKVFDGIKGWFSLTHKKIRDRKDFRYIKCPICKAQLRVRNKKGRHTVSCPRCGSEFEKKI